MSNRKKYSKEFKLDAVSLVLDQGYSRAEAARSLGLNGNMLGRWVLDQRTDGGQAFRGNGKITLEHDEFRKFISQLKKNLKMDKEILKKATVFFAKEMK